MALTVGDRHVRPLTADEAMQMVHVGIIGADERVELLHGVLTAMIPQHPPHATCVQRLNAWLAPLMVAATHDVRIQLPFSVPDPTSLPEPDVAVIERIDTTAAHPASALLVIEVACSSLRVDMVVKAPLYAAAGISEYWVVDVAKHRVDVFGEPTGDQFARRETLGPPQSARPSHLPAEPLDLAELFAGL